MQRGFRFAGLLSVTVLVLAGAACKGAATVEKGTPEKQVEASTGKPGWETVTTSGFSVSVPEAWTPIDLSAENLDKILEEAGNQNAAFKATMPQVKQMAASGAVKLLVLAEADPNGVFAENMNVVRVEAQGEPTQAILETSYRQEMEGMKAPGSAIEGEHIDLPVGKAIRMQTSLQFQAANEPVHSLAYMFWRGRDVYTVTFSSLTSRADAMAKTAVEIMQTFKVE